MDKRPLFSASPGPVGLYRPEYEHDACGVAMVATLRGTPGHDIVEHALTALRNLDHRGATGADPLVGDGAGILTQIPDAFLREVSGLELPEAGFYVAGLAFLPDDADAAEDVRARMTVLAMEEGLRVIGWRDVPTNPDVLGGASRDTMPQITQVFLESRGEPKVAGIDLDRRAFCFRKRAERDLDVYFPSLSSRTLVYKGMLTTEQLDAFYPDIVDPRFTTELAIIHQRFSTNTFPSWPLAHPFRFVAHNGEFNTVKGNRNWMFARESMIASDELGGNLERLSPICTPSASDSASFDEVLELLHLGGRSLPHAVLMMIPEAWENNPQMDPKRRAFYEFHASMMEPWDGPADVVFSDGTLVGAVLDRNGLRPGRYSVSDDGLVVLASETGVIDIEPSHVVAHGRLQPGAMFLVDTANGRLIPDEEIKAQLAAEYPYDEWLLGGLVHLPDLAEREHVAVSTASINRRQQVFGYSIEDITTLLVPMARTGAEPIGSMGNDAPLAVLSDRPRVLFDYFQEMFAQVTNPPLDAIREELVTSLATQIGPEGNLLDTTPAACRQVVLPRPVIDNDELAKIVHINAEGDMPGYATAVIEGVYDVAGGGTAMEARLAEIFDEVSDAIERGVRFIVLSTRNTDRSRAPIPSLLLTAAVHHHLIREKTRTKVGLIIEAGDVREVHHVALLIGYGAAAVNPYLAMESIEHLVIMGMLNERFGREPRVDTLGIAVHNLLKALNKGVIKVMSKMGISTVASYRGAQVFEAIGLDQEFVDKYFTGTVSQLGGVGIDVIAAEVAKHHARAYPPDGNKQAHRVLDVGGQYQWRREGEQHLLDPEAVFRLQYATRNDSYDVFKQYSSHINDQAERLMTLRALMRFKDPADFGRAPISIDEVEPVSEIVKRFSTGAMSYGSISQEAHQTLAIAMNRLGARSNTGEGGEDTDRLLDPERRSAIKQVASGRFGVTALYLTQATDIQIKMAQGAKPGEGGQLPGKKVYPWVAKTRFSTPGVGLISPPPHHDIYSIEDLAQLISDLKNANPQARIHVKLVAQIGVGTVAAGVSKAHADVVLISGHDGGTGAAPLTSLKHAGGPWELGLAETQQTLVLNGLRDRIVVQVDGQLKTGRDVVIGALLGAEEFGFATLPLVVEGCIMMRKCHLDTCPVGVATQNPTLRSRFSGKPEYVVTFFEYIAQEVREILAELGFRTLQEAVGAVEVLDVERAIRHWKADGLDIAPILVKPDNPFGGEQHHTRSQDHGLDKVLDRELIREAEPALADGTAVTIDKPVRNVHRAIGTMLGHELIRRHHEGLAPGTIRLNLVGSAGQSLGAFMPQGIAIDLVGDANDYVGKGLSGGSIVVRPSPDAGFDPSTNVIAGNVIGYGATGGEMWLSGVVGERCAVRNSGATIVVEALGDHGCEYMTGGRVVVLGPTGRNFGAGMSGGAAYVLDVDPDKVNRELVDLLPVDVEHASELREIVERHAELTGSARARELLDDWQLDRFTLIMPRLYQAITAIRREAADQGNDPDDAQTWERILEVSHG